jgi:hypothetical protein
LFEASFDFFHGQLAVAVGVGVSEAPGKIVQRLCRVIGSL